MAVAVSAFYTTPASVDGLRSTYPTSAAIGKRHIGFTLPQLGTYAEQVYDGLNPKRGEIKSLLTNDCMENNDCDLYFTSRGVSHQLAAQDEPISSGNTSHTPPSEVEMATRPRSPFHKWMVSIQKRNKPSPASHMSPRRNLPDWLWTADGGCGNPRSCYSTHAKSSSGSSFNFVSAVRSASVSLAGFSTVARSRANTAMSICVSQIDQGADIFAAELGESEVATSIDGLTPLDSAALDRTLKRRRILEELIHTEQNYVGDIKLLSNVYVTMLVSLPSAYPGLRRSVNQNLSDILQLHEGFLNELLRAVSHPECKEFGSSRGVTAMTGHSIQDWTQIYSPTGGGNILHNCSRPTKDVAEICAEPQVLVEVSKIFDRKMSRFFIYKEYGAKYEMMVQETASVYEALPGWDWNQKGLEALSALLGSRGYTEYNTKRASTMKDLLVKPIQRICKYPLIFGELLKYTPVSDCPNAHMAAEGVLTRFREATAEINRATNDPQMRNTLSRSWLLQDRLMFPNRNIDAVSKDRVRSFGHVRLCGTLYICWQTQDGVDGQYLICLLYPNVLCLAYAGKVDPIYTIKACIDVREVKVEDADNGRGLQCHTAPFSWKLVFECHHQLFEIIMTACTAKEEMEWRARLTSPLTPCNKGGAAGLAFLDLDIKCLGVVASETDPGARRLSIRRATTVCPKPALYQVVLKNTSGVRQTSAHASTPLNIHRSHSLLATKSRMSFLAPPRSERARLEAILADVWSREILPFPGMGSRSRSERLVRTSASTVIRKLSVASIANSFAKRAGGLRQRMSLEDSFRPYASDTASANVLEPTISSKCGSRVGDLEKQKSSIAQGKMSAPQTETGVSPSTTCPGAEGPGWEATVKRKPGRSGYGFRGIFR